MTRANTRTLLPLDDFFRILGSNPLHAAQIQSAAIPNTVCSSIMKQEAWMDAQMVSRSDIAIAISAAESQISEYVNFSILPTWTVDERATTVRPANPMLLNQYGRDLRGFPQSVQLAQGKFISGGIEAKVLIQAGAVITYTDPDGDGYPEVATVTFATTVTDPAELAVYYPGESADDAWEIRPLRSVTIAAGVATIVMRREQLPLPELLDALVPEAIDGDDDSQFLADCDIYRHYNNIAQQTQLLWSPLSGFCGDCGDAGTCYACQAAAQWGCLLGQDYEQGIVHYSPALWDAGLGAYQRQPWSEWRAPDRLRLWYYAGYEAKGKRYPTLQMDDTWARAVVYLSLTLLDREICSCSNVTALTRHWKENLSMNDSSAAGSTSYQVSKIVRENPWGATRGAAFAWEVANRESRFLAQAVKL